MCCKVLAIPEFESPRDAWCPQCAVGKGCGIYDVRPERCRIFNCGYLVWDRVAEHWFPAKSRIVISSENGNRLGFYVDASQPGRWREQPYYNDIKAMAASALNDGYQVLVCVGKRVIAVFPDRDVDLGLFADDETAVTGKRPDGTWGAAKLRIDDPRLNGSGGSIALQ